MQRSLIGVGPALRKARLHRGVSLEQAGRDTRIRPDFIRALEDEEFEALLGDVYVRGALRTYAGYLGLDPGKVVGAYARAIGEPEAVSPEPSVANERVVRTNRTPNWGVALLVAGVILVVAAAFGVLSRSNSSPSAAKVEVGAGDALKAGRQITATLEATDEVRVTITADGVVAFDGRMVAGEGRSFAASRSLTVELSRGGVVRLGVSGVDKGTPGTENRPYRETFSFAERNPSPSSGS